jgi:DNA polymerase III epsilon subunit-like protein
MIGLDLATRVWRRLVLGDVTPIEALLEPGFVAIDLETTGLNVRRAAVVAVAAIPFERGEARDGFVTLVNPERPIPPESTAIHGIDDVAVAGAPPVRDVLPRFAAVCARRIVVGHDVSFDLAVLARVRSGHAGLDARLTLDTRRLARATGYRDSRLEVVAADLGIPVSGRHTAEGDARMAGEILLRLLPLLRHRGFRTLGDLLTVQRRTPARDR